MFTYEAVEKLIRGRIASGLYAPGQRLDSLRQIASAAGTSTLTVRRALKTLVEEGVIRGEHGRGYFVNHSKLPVRQHEKGTVGLLVCVVESVQDPADTEFFSAALGPIQGTLLTHQRSGLVISVGRGFSDEGVYQYAKPSEIADRGLEGAVIMGVYDDVFLREFKQLQPNVVVMDLNTTHVGLDSVSFDNMGSALDMTQRFVRRGAREIAFVGGPFPPHRETLPVVYDPCSEERFDGWRLGLQAMGIEFDSKWMRSMPYRMERFATLAVKEMFEEGLRPDAIITEFPEGVLKGLREAGVEPGAVPVGAWVPQHHDNTAIELQALCDFAEMGRRAIDVLMYRIENPKASLKRELVPLNIVDRRESNVDAGPDKAAGLTQLSSALRKTGTT